MDKQMKGSSLKKIGALLPWLWLAAGYVLDMWFQLVPGKWIVDSDLASEMMLTKILNQEGSILSHSWYYSTELRVVNMQWFYRLGLLLFPDDWHPLAWRLPCWSLLRRRCYWQRELGWEAWAPGWQVR